MELPLAVDRGSVLFGWLPRQLPIFPCTFFSLGTKIGLKLSYEANKVLPEVSQHECATFPQVELLGAHRSPASSLATLSLPGL